jgi:hypothetical protein
MLLRKCFILLLAGLCSCTDSSLLKKIPADAELVVVADFKKLALSSISPGGMLFSGQNETKKEKSEELWKNSGIDILSESVIFSRSNSLQESCWFLLLPLSDADEFRNFCEKNGAQPDNNAGQDWLKKGKFRILIQKELAIGITAPEAATIDEIKKEVLSVISLKEEENLLAKSKSFQTLKKEDKALCLWANLEHSLSGLSLFIPSEMLQGEITGLADFKSGELFMEGRYFAPDSLNGTQILGPPIQKELITSIGSRSGNAGVLALSLALPPIYKMLESIGYSSTGSIMAAQYGLNLEEIMQTLSGEIVLTALSGKGTSGDFPETLLQLGLKKPADDIFGKLTQAGILVPAGDGTFRISGSPELRIRKQEKFMEVYTEGFRISISPDRKLEEFASAVPAQVICSINLQHLTEAFPDNQVGTKTGTAGKYWKNFRMRISREENGNSLMTCHLECMNEDDNSLLTLLKCLADLSREYQDENNQTENPPPLF